MRLPYESLTQRGQLGRLRALGLRALDAHYALDVRRVRLIGGYTNALFRVETPQGVFALRVDRMEEHSEVDNHIELAWLETLAHAGLPVPRPIRTRDGARFVSVGSEGVPRPRRCTVFGWIPGRPVFERQSEAVYRRVGALSARLHAHGKHFVPPHQPMVWDRPFYFPAETDPVVWDAPQHADRYPPGGREVVAEAVKRVAVALAAVPDAERQLVHGDLHPWNVHVCRNQVYALDFEDVMWASPAQDLGITLYYLHAFADPDDAEAVARRDAHIRAVREGYETVAPWPASKGQIDAYVHARRVMFVNFLLNSNPDTAEDYLRRSVPRLERFLRG